MDTLRSGIAGYAYAEIDGRKYAVASTGAHPAVAKHMTPALRAAYGPYQELARFPWTSKGRKECMAFVDAHNAPIFAEVMKA